MSRRRSGGRYTTRRYVTFFVDGEEYAYIYAANAASTADVGDTITIHYDPDDPRSIAAGEQSYTYRIAGTVLGILAAGLGVKRLLKMKKADQE